MHPCPGRCNRTWRAAEVLRLQLGRTHERVPVTTDDALCASCWRRVDLYLADLPGLYEALATDYLHASRPINERVSGSGAATLNVYLDLMDRMVRFVTGWDDGMAGLRTWRTRKPRPGREAVVDSVAELRRFGEWINTHDPDAADRSGELARLHGLAERATKRDEMFIRLPAPCPTCDLRALVRREPYKAAGDKAADPYRDHIECRGCGRIWHEDDYARLVLILASEVSR